MFKYPALNCFQKIIWNAELAVSVSSSTVDNDSMVVCVFAFSSPFAWKTVVAEHIQLPYRYIKRFRNPYNISVNQLFHPHKNIRTCLHKIMRTSFRQILPLTASKILAIRQYACGFFPCNRQNLLENLHTYLMKTGSKEQTVGTKHSNVSELNWD